MEELNPNHLPFELTKEFLEDIRLLIENQANEELLLKLDELFPADITHILIELTTEEAKYIVLLIDTKIAAEIISTLDSDDRKKFLKNFTSKEIATYINVIDSDDAVDILNEQPVKVREEVIALLKDREQARFIIDLMHYDEDCAGGLMQKELIKINISQTVTECVEEIRKQAEDVEKVYSVYVIDDDGKLLGTVSLKKIILAKRGSKIADVYEDDEIVSVQTYASGEEVADLMQK
jgi:magnesium transporter